MYVRMQVLYLIHTHIHAHMHLHDRNATNINDKCLHRRGRRSRMSDVLRRRRKYTN